jgi:cell division protein FtsI (penicillin-binding protein 3)
MARESGGRSDSGDPQPQGQQQRARGGLSAARTYRPRGRTVREGYRGGDPFRPALKVLEEPAPPEPAPRKPTRATTTGTRAGGSGGSRAGKPSPNRTPSAGKQSSRPTPGGSSSRGSSSREREEPHRRHTGRADGSARSRRPPKLAEPQRRLRLATLLALSLLAVLGVRLIELQLTDGPAYAASGLANRLQSVVLPAPRGAIYDRHGAVLAHSIEARFVFADPELVVDPEYNAAQLAPLLGIPAPELADQMRPRIRDNGEMSRFEWLARGVDLDTARAVMAMNLSGIGVDRDERRHVPGNDLAANLIGFTGTDLAGLAGLEAHFDQVLRGTNGRRTFETGLGGRLARQIPGGYLVETPAQPGSHLRLTIDADLQYEVQRILADWLSGTGASFGAAVVLDTRTFEVLGQASYPGYNAADPLRASEQQRRDAATAIVFDPGSAHKPLVLGAALQEGTVASDSSVVVDPTIQKGDVTFQDFGHWHPPGTRLTLPAIMAFSSNVGTIRIADQLGPEALHRYQQAFGLGERTGVMPGEAPGALLAPADWSGSSYGSVPIGHSVDVTTLQLAAAYGVIANDGAWMRPSLVKSVIEADGSESPAAEPETRRVLSPQIAAQLREMMEAVVAVPGATGTAAAVDGYRVAGKTGTGKLVVDGEYAVGNVASFFGMAPAEAPRFVVAVVAHLPEGGGEVAGPAFQEMMGFALKHYRVPPSSTGPPDFELYR